MSARILAVLAAIFLVIAFALATLLPPMLSLGELAAMVDHPTLVAVQDWTRMQISQWAWDQLAMPLLERPCWLVPIAIGLVCTGAAVTLASRGGVRRSHRRRS